MNYIGDSVAVGMLMMNKDGFDEMAVFHGIINEKNGSIFLEVPNDEPMEMSEKWLTKLKPVEKSMGERFQGAKYCLVIGSTAK